MPVLGWPLCAGLQTFPASPRYGEVRRKAVARAAPRFRALLPKQTYGLSVVSEKLCLVVLAIFCRFTFLEAAHLHEGPSTQPIVCLIDLKW